MKHNRGKYAYIVITTHTGGEYSCEDIIEREISDRMSWANNQMGFDDYLAGKLCEGWELFSVSGNRYFLKRSTGDMSHG